MHMRQAQRLGPGFAPGRAGGFAQHHILLFHIGPEARPAAADRAGRYIHAAGRSNTPNNIALIALNIGHNGILDGQHQGYQDDRGDDRAPEQHFGEGLAEMEYDFFDFLDS